MALLRLDGDATLRTRSDSSADPAPPLIRHLRWSGVEVNQVEVNLSVPDGRLPPW